MAASGAEAKRLLAEHGARVNGQPDARRGRKLRPGDTVQIGEEKLSVTSRPAAAERP